MAVNLTPQYHQAEEEFKKAQSAEERLACLRKMYQLVPKHKASEKLQAELKTKMSDLKEEVEREKKSPKKVGVSYKIPKQGAGQYVFLGAPNAGKSRLLTRLTRATPEVAAYPFTTREPVAGMMEWQDVRIQLIDLPPITAEFHEPFVTSMTRSADAALLFVDIGDDDGPFGAQTVVERLAEHKTILNAEVPAEPPAAGIEVIRTMLVANKCTSPGAADRMAFCRELFGDRFSVHQIDAEQGTGLDELREAMFRFLNVIRVFSKEPGKPIDKTAPFTCPVGSSVAAFAGCVHRDFEEKCRSARVWGSGAFDGQTVGRDHVLSDGDVVELHV
ncbi:MAG: GTPase [Gemmataceae bacterium]